MKLIIYLFWFCPLFINGQTLPKTEIKNIKIDLCEVVPNRNIESLFKDSLVNRILQTDYVKSNEISYFNFAIFETEESIRIVVTPTRNIDNDQILFGYLECNRYTFFILGDNTLFRKTNKKKRFSIKKEIIKLGNDEISLPSTDVPTWYFSVVDNNIQFDRFIEKW